VSTPTSENVPPALPGKDAGVDQARKLDTSEVADYAGLLRLDGRAFVVAGAGQGIGRQITHALAQNGAKLLCLDYDQAAAQHVAGEVGAVPATADVRERGDIEAAFTRAKDEFGRVDGVVDIVGMAKYAALLQTSEDDWSWTFDMVLRHAWLISQVGGEMMRQQERRDDNGQRGVFAFVGSASGITGAPLHAAYGAAKAGLLSLVRSIAVEFGPMGMRSNAVAPGVVWTPRIGAMIGEQGREQNAKNTPLRRVAEPRDIASVLLFLLSDLSAYVSGQVISIDGGVSAKFPYPLGE
jgi:NAD(P)-dependent dehydrogenase (short-subunit alcohol dehydrogenase family)